MNVKRFFNISLVLVIVMVGVFASPRQAAAGGGGCLATYTSTYRFTTVDNGMHGSWAVDFFTSTVTVCQTGASTYQVTFNDNGSSFLTLAAKSPGGNGTTTVGAGIRGTINGGETVVITGVLKSPFPTNVGPIDFTNNHTPNKYFLPFFDSIASVSYVSWGWSYSTCGNGTWNDNDAAETQYGLVGPNSLMGDITGTPAACQNQTSAQWFNPQDGRVDPRPGDRLVIYCNINADPPNVVAYGTKDDAPDWQKGFWLATFVNADLLKAGTGGITKKAANYGGTISMMQDGQGHYYAAWNGGVYRATGVDDFSKVFTCDFAK